MAEAVRRLALALGLLLAGGFIASGAPQAQQADTTGQQRVIEKARLTVEAFLDDPHFQDMHPYVRNAYGVLIVPELLTGGFIIGAEHGVGVLLARDVATGEWGAPAFFTVYGGRFGLQFGGKTSDAVYTIMNEAAVRQLMAAKLKLGADASAALGRVGGGFGAGLTAAFGDDIYAFFKAKGLFGGLAFAGSAVVPNHDWNAAYYGRAVAPEEILRARDADGRPGTAALRQALKRFEQQPLPSTGVAALAQPPAPAAAPFERAAPPAGAGVADARSTVLVTPLEPLDR